MEIIIITLLVILLAVSVRAYLRQRALAQSRLDELNEKARKANPPPEPDILSGTGRLHPNGSVYFKLSDGRYGSLRDDGSVFTVPEAEYYTGEPLRKSPRQRRIPLVGSGRRSTAYPQTHWAYSDGSYGRYDHNGRFVQVTKEFYDTLWSN